MKYPFNYGDVHTLQYTGRDCMNFDNFTLHKVPTMYLVALGPKKQFVCNLTTLRAQSTSIFPEKSGRVLTRWTVKVILTVTTRCPVSRRSFTPYLSSVERGVRRAQGSLGARPRHLSVKTRWPYIERRVYDQVDCPYYLGVCIIELEFVFYIYEYLVSIEDQVNCP